MEHTLDNAAAEYAELELTVRKIRQQIDSRRQMLAADENDLERAETARREARARLIEATHRETR